MELNYLHLRSFYAVALERNISKAARRLNISQPTLSKQIKALEERHKVKLIEGNRPPLRLTPAAEALLEKTRQLFETAEEIGAILGQEEIDETTLLRLGTDSPPYAAEFLAALAQRLPSLKFRVTVANATQTAQALVEAQIDLAILCDPIIRSDYIYEPIYRDSLVLVAPSGRTDLPERISLDLIAEETLLVREPSSRTLAMSQRLLSEHDVHVRSTMKLHTREMIREAVANGLGISLMFRKECPPDPRIRIIEIDAPATLLRTHGYLAVHNEHRRRMINRIALEVGAKMIPSEAANLA